MYSVIRPFSGDGRWKAAGIFICSDNIHITLQWSGGEGEMSSPTFVGVGSAPWNSYIPC